MRRNQFRKDVAIVLWTGSPSEPWIKHQQAQRQTLFSYLQNDFSLDSPAGKWGIITLLCFPGLLLLFLILKLSFLLITKTGSKPSGQTSKSLVSSQPGWRDGENTNQMPPSRFSHLQFPGPYDSQSIAKTRVTDVVLAATNSEGCWVHSECTAPRSKSWLTLSFF